MLELLFSLLSWLSLQSGSSAAWNVPSINMVSQQTLCQHYGITESQCRAAGLVAFYDKQGGIWLRNDFDRQNPRHVARLVHELVHHLQYENEKDKEQCLGKLEVEAYDLQNTWLEQRELPPAIGSFRRTLFLASCDS